MKIGIIGDVHLGIKRFKELSFQAFEKAVKLVSECDCVFILGDLFHVVHPPIDTIYRANMILKKWLEGKRLFLLTGNHEMRAKNEINALHLIFLNNVKVAEYKAYKEGDAYFFSFPYFPFHLQRKQFKEMEKIAEQMEGLKILFMHNDVYPLTTLKKEMAITLEELERSCFDFIFAGHYHGFYEGKKVFFPGSLIPTSFRDEEAGERYVLILDTERREVTKKKVETIEMKIIELDITGMSLEEIGKKVKELSFSQLTKIKIKGRTHLRRRDINAVLPRKDNLFFDFLIEEEKPEKIKTEKKAEIEEIKWEVIYQELASKLKILDFESIIAMMEESEEKALEKISQKVGIDVVRRR